jgi:hypothetical protein
VSLGCGLVSRISVPAARFQELAKARDGIFVPPILLEATALVEDVGRILGADEKVRQEVDTFGVVAAQACLPRGILLGLFAGGHGLVGAGGRRCPKEQRHESNRENRDEGAGGTSATLAHGGEV